MKTTLHFLISISVIALMISCGMIEKNGVEISLRNTSDNSLQDYAIYINLDSINKNVEAEPTKLAVYNNKNAAPYQIISKTNGKKYLLTLVDIEALGSKELVIKPIDDKYPKEWEKRTHAELAIKTGGEWIDRVYKKAQGYTFVDSLRVPVEHTDHSYYIKYEGPGWESDKVAYRFYLDWRNAVDIFGKLTTDITLPQVGMDNFDSYHEYSDWGMDILKVGNSLGIGSIGTWDGEKAERVAKTDSVITVIEADGILYSQFTTNYYNWQSANGAVDLKSTISIMAGSRMTKQVLEIKGEISNIATGIVKGKEIPLIKGPADTKWGYIATWGKQSLNNDNLGMAVFFKNDDIIEITEDALNHVVVLKPNENNKVKYFYAAVWEKENKKKITEEDFMEYLENSVVFLSRPVKVE